MRKGVADLHRRSVISQKSNDRYLDALSACESTATLFEELQKVCQRTKKKGRCARALNPWSKLDYQLLSFLAQGQWALNGFRNRELARWIEPTVEQLDPAERKKLTARISRLLRLLRTHGLIRKVPKSHRYLLTPSGRQIASLVLTASTVRAQTLMEIAA